MKFSEAQQKVLMGAYDDIKTARTYDYPEWFGVTEANHVPNPEKCIEEGYLKDIWLMNSTGVVVTRCNTRTLKKLEELGIIEILEVGYVDLIKVHEEELINAIGTFRVGG